MAMEFDIIKVGKMLDRAGHPGTPDPERVLSVAKAYSYCSANGRTFADVASCMGMPVFIEVNALSNYDLREQIADLSLGRDDDAVRIDELTERVASLEASNDRLREERDALQAQVNVLESRLAEARRDFDERRCEGNQSALTADLAEPDEEPIQDVYSPSVGEAIEAEMVSDRLADPSIEPSRDTLSSLVEETVKKEVISDHHDELDDAAWSQFTKLAQTGLEKRTIARRLSKMLGRVINYASVCRWMRDRWCPQSGSRFALRHARRDAVYC